MVLRLANVATPHPRAPKAELSEEAWFHILWFSAAMLGMPALIATLILLF